MPRLLAAVSGSFAATALALTLLGVYGIMAYSVQRQTRELGVRVAFGAERADILRLVMRRGIFLIAWGSLLGVLAAALLSRLMASLLFGFSPWHSATYGAVLLAVSASSLLACYLPARRAAALDPAVALRSE